MTQDLAQISPTSAEPDRVRVIREGIASYLPDIDPEETTEWLESFDELLDRSGSSRSGRCQVRHCAPPTGFPNDSSDSRSIRINRGPTLTAFSLP
jgi:hypothetical protein